MLKMLWEKPAGLKHLNQLAQAMVQELLSYDPFVLWLDGDVGTGKTTVVQKLLVALGLPANTKVLSPTFTYLNEYAIAEVFYGHMDFYRSPRGGYQEEDLLFTLDHRAFRGFFIEWGESLGQAIPHELRPTHRLLIKEIKNGQSRNYQLLRLEGKLSSGDDESAENNP